MVLSTASMKADSKDNPMKYVCLKGVVTSKGVAAPGDIVELAGLEAKVMVSQGKFAEVEEKAAPVIQHRDPVAVQPAFAAPAAAPRRGRPPKAATAHRAEHVDDATAWGGEE